MISECSLPAPALVLKGCLLDLPIDLAGVVLCAHHFLFIRTDDRARAESGALVCRACHALNPSPSPHRETVIGHAEVKQIFKLSKGIVAGCLVTDGRIARTARARVLRKRQPVYDGGLSTLRRFQDDVKEARSGLECGIKLGDFSEYQVGDIIECYQLEQIARKL